jgi:hypothetical protein
MMKIDGRAKSKQESIELKVSEMEIHVKDV